MTPTAEPADRAEQLREQVARARIRGPGARAEQAVRLGGAGVMAVGMVLIVAGYIGASGPGVSLNSQISYLISGGLVGLGLVAIGAALYLRAWLARQRYWLARIALENREHAEAIVAAISRLEQASPAPGRPQGRAAAGQ
ncbi:MAG TPA: hypothetical protein VKY15_05510 [Acidimicrobiales bacterium]|nr:hypothetical protein [Acidimicrobiales bacterium]